MSGDATGLHVLAADAASGYAWRTVATLSVPGTETTQWIGQACLTGGGERAVVVYAPRQITNVPDALGYGALAAVVNLSTGKVTRLGAGFSIGYFNPGCGTGQYAVLTQGGTGAGPRPAPAVTKLMVLDTVTGKFTVKVTIAGQVTSAVPFGREIAAVRGADVVSVGAHGAVGVLTAAQGQPYQLVPDAAGGLGYQVASGSQVQLRRWAQGRDRLIGSAPLGSVDLSQVGGRVFVTGARTVRLSSMPDGWHRLVVPAGADISSTGLLAITGASAGLYGKGRSPLAPVPDLSQPVHISAEAAATGKKLGFTVAAAAPVAAGSAGAGPAGAAGTAQPTGLRPGRPAARAGNKLASANPATVTYDPDRSCSVPRDDPTVLTYQPSPQQIEWAADQAVRGKLTASLPANLYGSGLPSYSPQGWFPAPGLDGGGTVPAQVLLGILAQESNEDQASDHTIIGQVGNFMPSSNWYGDGGVFTSVHWAKSDCGYGIAQVTSGMCRKGFKGCTGALAANHQLAIAVDYQANIAAGLQILEQKWNALSKLGIKANGGNPGFVEDWWFALWAYNAGLEPNTANGNKTGCSPSPTCTDGSGNWGLGWVDNPANPLYKPDRPMFLEGKSGTQYTYNWDEAHPQYWSYEEKVVGFGAFGFLSFNYISQSWGEAFSRTAYPGNDRDLAQPHIPTFCSTASGTNDHCNPSAADTASACQLTSGATADHCWWHWPITWADCAKTCGVESLAYQPGAKAPGDPGVPRGYAPQCSSSPLPGSAVIVGGVASSIPKPYGCGTSWKHNGGTITWSFASDPGSNPATYPSKIDFHQIGAGYGGHFWFTHTIPNAGPSLTSTAPAASVAELKVTGTWKAPSSVHGWTRVMVSVPNEGAWDPEANYQIHPGSGATQTRIVNQAYQGDSWVSLGFFDLAKGASVSLTNVTWLGLGDDVAWGAVAFIPASKPAADYVAVGDSYSSAEGLSPYGSNSDYNYSGMQDTCHRSATQAFPDLVALPGGKPIAQQAASPSSKYQLSYLPCSGVLTPDITQNDVDGPSSPYFSWDNAGYTQWTTASEGSGGPAIINELTRYSASSTSIELPQADQGWLSPATTLVTITQGGDDARFSSVVSACMETDANGGECSAASYFLKQLNGVTDPQPLYKFEPQVISAVKPHLVLAYKAIAAAAPHAKIIVLGYPRLFSGDQNPSGPCSTDAVTTVPIPDVQMLNTFGDELDTAISQAVAQEHAAGVNIHYINPNPGFSGHQLCSSAPWINGIVNSETSKAGVSVPGLNSFHLRAPGQREYATLVNECLAGRLPKADGTC